MRVQHSLLLLERMLCCVLPSHIFWTTGGVFVDVPAGVTQEEGHKEFLHLPCAVLALIFLARRIQPFLSLVDREVEFCVLTIYYYVIALHLLGIYCSKKNLNASKPSN